MNKFENKLYKADYYVVNFMLTEQRKSETPFREGETRFYTERR